MKKAVVLTIVGWLLIAAPAYGVSSCESSLLSSTNHNSIVWNWIGERDTYAMKLVRAWVSGEPKESIAELVGLVWASETKLAAECRKETDFLKRHLILYGELPFPLTVDTAPPLILQWLISDDMLSPERQYQEEEVRHDTAR